MEQADGFGEVARIFELGGEAEEGGVAAEGEDDVADGRETFGEVCVDDGEDFLAGVGDTDSDHGNDHCGQDANE